MAGSAKLHCFCCALLYSSGYFFHLSRLISIAQWTKKMVLSRLAHGISLTKIQRLLLKKLFWPSATPQNDEVCIAFHVNPDRTKMWNKGLNSKVFSTAYWFIMVIQGETILTQTPEALVVTKLLSNDVGSLLVNIKHDWDYILSAVDDTQEMEPKHCKNFTQFQVKLEGQWLTSVWKIKQHLEFCSGDVLSENSRLLM